MDDLAYFRLRIPLDLKAKIEAESKYNNRSMNAEILKIIENYFEKKDSSKHNKQMAFSSFPHALQQLIENASKQRPKDSFSILLEKINKIDDDIKHIKDKLDKE